MGADVVDGIVTALTKSPHVRYICADVENNFYVSMPIDEDDPTWQDFLPALYVDFSQGLNCEAYTIAAEISDKATAYSVAAGFPSVDVIRFSMGAWYRFADKKADKWDGVKALAAHLNITAEDIVSFGDDFSDVLMLKNSGIGVAMADAVDDCKSVADFTCGTCNDDGVAKWLQENVLFNGELVHIDIKKPPVPTRF
jgi:hypothetical protein